MAERKSKREQVNATELDSEDVGFVLEPTKVEVGSGYTVSVSYDEKEKPVVNVKIYGEVDTAKLRREIDRVFPNALIRQLNRSHSITVVKKRRRKHQGKGE